MDYKCLGKHFSVFDKKSFKKWGISNNLDGSEDDFFVNFYFYPKNYVYYIGAGGTRVNTINLIYLLTISIWLKNLL